MRAATFVAMTWKAKDRWAIGETMLAALVALKGVHPRTIVSVALVVLQGECAFDEPPRVEDGEIVHDEGASVIGIARNKLSLLISAAQKPPD